MRVRFVNTDGEAGPLHIYMYSVSSKGPFWPYLGSRLPSIHCTFAQRVRSYFLESHDIGFSPPGNPDVPSASVLRPDGEEWSSRGGSWNEDISVGRQTSLKVGFCVRFVVLRTNFLSKIDFGWIVNFLQGRKGIFNLVKGTRYGFLGKKRKDIGFGYREEKKRRENFKRHVLFLWNNNNWGTRNLEI